MSWERRAFDLACGVGRKRRLLIFTFHRVPPDPDPLLPGDPCADAFAERVRWIADYLHVLPLPEAAERLHRGDLPARAACITFDDGYRTNFEVARPMLDRAGLPASFFIATAAIDHGAMWNDLVVEAIRGCGSRVDLEAFGLEGRTVASETLRPQVLLRVLEELKYLPMDRRGAIADALYTRYHPGRPLDLMMTRDMVRRLAQDGHDVGAHTVSHPILQKLEADAARREIEASRAWVAEITGVSPKSFAYPNGRAGVDFSEAHMKMVAESGFRCAVSTTWGCATASSNVFSLERFTPWESSRSGFVSRILKTYARSYVSTG